MSANSSGPPPELLTATLDSLAAQVVILDEDGTIIYVNNAWRKFARANGYTGSSFWVGTQYLDACAPSGDEAKTVAGYFDTMMKNRAGDFHLTYPCHSPDEMRWFQMRLQGFSFDDRFYMVVVHENITEVKMTERRLVQALEYLGDANARLDDALLQSIGALSRAVEYRDLYTAGHQKSVGNLSVRIARELCLGREMIRGIRLGAMVHDIGKIGIPSDILNLPRQLNDIEYDLVRTHARIGYDILKEARFPWPLAEMVYQHHERLDGSGYPRRLANGDIIVEARIIAVADVADSISSHRPYRPARGTDVAIVELERGRGTAYDTDITDVCIRILKNYPDPLGDVEDE